MTDATSPNPERPGIGQIELERPAFPEPDEPVLMHDDFNQIADDTQGSFQAVCVLMQLLKADGERQLTPQDRAGLAVLLEGVRYRLELAADGLRAMGQTLGIPEESSLATDNQG